MKKKIVKGLLRVFLTVAAVSGLFLLYVQFSYKKEFEVPETGIRSSRDAAVIARGRYLVMGPSHCWTCHAADGVTNVQNGTKLGLSGGLEIKLPFGTLYTPNITPDSATGIGSYSDEMLARAIRNSVKHDNTAMVPFMTFNTMSDQDISAIISYLRRIEPISHAVPENDLNILGKIVARFVLKPSQPTAPSYIAPDTTAEYGKYLAISVANCVGCHTQRGKTGEFIGKEFSGGYQMPVENGIFGTPNLTPDKETGILASWTVNDFIKRFETGAAFPNSPMPWKSFQSFTKNDLKALYYFFQSLEPVKNQVPRFTRAQAKSS
ncbi:cytochrome c [Dyadobacter sp. CY261]|uniref:c-type cytochrome n=1 Tax=Dyadobacter sp. CY261 TaxID=2907203 RepID=UPI001F300D0B|nr:c-type cytochrome [Dyadobacter sp. CY261]MCF0074220.1 cytochrome c [Dyadobacter sp. CY261]